jgi:hypothetical protein
MNGTKNCKIEPSTLAEQIDAFEIIAEQIRKPYIREGCTRLIQEALSGRIVDDGICSEQTSLTIDEITIKVLDALGK